MAKQQKPFDKIMTVRSTLDMYLEYGDVALRDQSLDDFLKDVQEAYGHLMAFRNMVNGMAKMDEAPDFAVLPYLSSEAIAEAAQ